MAATVTWLCKNISTHVLSSVVDGKLNLITIGVYLTSSGTTISRSEITFGMNPDEDVPPWCLHPDPEGQPPTSSNSSREVKSVTRSERRICLIC
ncbi:hypothetical protein ZHAS_00017950 [Anopheles sinensis]|uniref:Uncharacterized protein n=1 Tax=Anopheles sinensis TaxID=74873 RepID=A0A084WI74_ANOSI|nr:hypothetical protein ZHAS_00017950 [Anopheles sinensis]